jgi:hypothetical protein
VPNTAPKLRRGSPAPEGIHAWLELGCRLQPAGLTHPSESGEASFILFAWTLALECVNTALRWPPFDARLSILEDAHADAETLHTILPGTKHPSLQERVTMSSLIREKPAYAQAEFGLLYTF